MIGIGQTISTCRPSHFVMINTEDSNRLRGVLKRQEPMSKHTSWRVGGTANCFYIPADIDDLSMFLAMQPENESIAWIGLGSNLLEVSRESPRRSLSNRSRVGS